MESILTSIKKLLGIAEDYTHFDADIIMHINTVLMDLNGLGVGPSTGFVIEDSTKTWIDFISNPKDLQAIKSYIYLRVKLLFDSSTLNSSTISSMERQIEKFEWLLSVAAENSKSGIIDENVSEEIKALIAELESENLTLKEANAKLESSNTAYKEANVTLNTKVSTLERTNSNLQVRVDTLEGLSSELQVSVDNLENEKTELENVIEESGIVNADGSVKEKIEQLIEKAKTGGKDYADIIYNDDDTVTLVEKNGTEHTISCEFDNNRIISMTYDGTEVAVVYNGDELVSVGETEVDVANVTLDNSLDVLIDQSRVLDSTEGTATEKVERLIDKAVFSKYYYEWSETTTTLSLKGWSGETIPLINPINATGLVYFLQDSQIEYIDFYINAVNCTTLHSAFYGCTKLKWIVGINTSACKTAPSLFRLCSMLETIQEPLDYSSMTNNASGFEGCIALKNIRFVPETIKLPITIPSAVLSDESIQSIIDGLATVETAQTLTLHSEVGAKLTDEQLLIIASKNWEVG